jgi:mono/diheme cytochrome c family protein
MACRILILIATIAIGLPWQAAVAGDIHVDQGHRFVRLHCAMCHSVEKFGESPLPIAPPFRQLHERYPIEDLAESLAEGIFIDHPIMPQFTLDPDQVSDVIAYLKTLED